MTLQLAAWTTPTISPSIEGSAIIREPVTGNLVIMTPTSAYYASDPSGPWTQSTGLHADWAFGLNMVTANGVIVAAGTQATPSLSRAVSRSTDGGVTWTTTLLETIVTTSINAVAYDPLYETFLHYSVGGVTDAEVRDSTDNGATWSTAFTITVPAGYDPVSVGVPSGEAADGVVVLTGANGTNDGMLYSIDGGYTFLEGTIVGDYDATSYGLGYPVRCGTRWVTPFVDGTGFGFLVSLDGETWTTVRPSSLSASTDQFGTAVWNSASNWLYYGNADGSFLSSDFATFVSVSGDDASSASGAVPVAAWDGSVLVQLSTVFSPSATPLRFALASDDGNVSISGLDHLEGKGVAVTVNGVVVASPNNPAYDPVVVTGGTITLVGPITGTVVIGLPYTTDIQTLDIDAVANTIKDRGQFSGGVKAWVQETGAFWAGPTEPTSTTSIATLEKIEPKDAEGNVVTTLDSGVISGVLLSTWNDNGRVFLRQVDPIPLTILGLSPQGHMGGR